MGMDRLDKRGESLHDLSLIFVSIYNERPNIIYKIIPSLQLCIKILQSYKRSNSFYLCARSTREVKLSNENKTFIWRARSNNKKVETFIYNDDFYLAREV